MRIAAFPFLRSAQGFAVALALLGAVDGAQARKPKAVAPPPPPPVQIERTGTYRLDAGPDIAGTLAITADGHFDYHLAAGALDEDASGTWEFVGHRTCLTTMPRPQSAAWQAKPVAKGPTVRVIWPSGQGIAGMGVRVGFGEDASGDLAGGYTLEDGWALAPDEKRVPRWVELTEPVHDLVSPRFPFDGARRLLVTLVPNDMGKADFDKTCLEQVGTALVLRRRDGDMKFYRFDR